ncbi:MAG: hypothetical protein KAH23_07015 [Kiritimatiellae bacterium]|nr:hypothetical protein [Kiritimatiellia bacterium]
MAVLKEHNFNCVWPAFQLTLPVRQYVRDNHYPDRGFLDRALHNGLDVVISAPDLDIGKKTKERYSPGHATDGIRYWSSHPAIIGFSVMDEPSYVASVNEINFLNIKAATEDLRRYSSIPPFVNLLPLWAPKYYIEHGEWKEPERLFTTKEYIEDWLDPYIEICKPSTLMFEYYLFADGKDKNNRANYYRHMHILSRKAVEKNLDFIYLTCPWFDYRTYPYRVKNTNMCRFSLFSALTYGVTGIFYWAREFSPNPNKHYLPPNSWDVRMEQGTKDTLKGIHKQINDNSDIILSLQFQNCYHVSDISTIWEECRDKLLPESSWSKFADDDIAKKYFNVTSPLSYKLGAPIENLAISFMRDDKGSDYCWVFNKNIYNLEGAGFCVNLKNVDITDVFLGISESDTEEVFVHLDQGEAKLFRISKKK